MVVEAGGVPLGTERLNSELQFYKGSAAEVFPSQQWLLSTRSPVVILQLQFYQEINTGLAKAESILVKNICDIVSAA